MLEGTQTTTYERAGMTRVQQWLLLEANRLVGTGVLTVAIFVSVVALGPPFAEQIAAEPRSRRPSRRR